MLVLDQVCKKGKEFEIKDISFSLRTGYVMGLIGRNGAGKTTLMKLIANVYHKSSGKITVAGYDNVKEEVKAKEQLGYVMESGPFVSTYTATDNALLFGRYYRTWDQDRFAKLMNRFGVPTEVPLGKLSKGMEIQFQLAFAMAHRPKVLLLDEPTSNLDTVFRRELLEIVQDLLAKEEVAVLFSTHLTAELDQIADYITMIENGRMVFSEELDSLMNDSFYLKGTTETYDRMKNLLQDTPMIRRRGSQIELLTKDEKVCQQLLKASFVKEQLSIEEIMYFYSKDWRSYHGNI